MPICEPVTVVQRASYWLASITHTAHRPPQSHSLFFLANRNSSVIKQVGKMLRKNDSSSIQITIYSNPVLLAAIGLEVCPDPLLANRTRCQVGGFQEKSSFFWQVTSVGDELLSHLFLPLDIVKSRWEVRGCYSHFATMRWDIAVMYWGWQSGKCCSWLLWCFLSTGLHLWLLLKDCPQALGAALPTRIEHQIPLDFGSWGSNPHQEQMHRYESPAPWVWPGMNSEVYFSL